MKIVQQFCLMPLLLLSACGNDPPCGEASVIKTARNLSAKFVINIGLPSEFPQDIDLSSPIELSSITVALSGIPRSGRRCAIRAIGSIKPHCFVKPNRSRKRLTTQP